MKRLVLFLALVFVFGAETAIAQITTSVSLGGFSNSTTGYNQYFEDGTRAVFHPASFSSGLVFGVWVGYEHDLRISPLGARLGVGLEIRASHAFGIRGGSTGILSADDATCIVDMTLLEGFACDEPTGRVTLVLNDLSLIVLGNLRVRGAKIYAGSGPIFRQSVVRTHGVRLTSTNFVFGRTSIHDLDFTAMLGASRPFTGRLRGFIEYDLNWVRPPRFNAEALNSFAIRSFGFENRNERQVVGGLTFQF